MSRIKKLETHYQEQLKNHRIDNVSVFVQSILNADVTKGKYARFLIEAFLNDKFLEEDLMGGLNSTVGQAISLFNKHKHKLPLEHRSVYALNPETGEALYQSPGDLWNSVKQFQGELSGKELKKEEQEQIYRETEFVYKDEETGFQIILPLTEDSAKWWGKGTRWCTSADNDNMFWHYAQDAPLFILLMPNGDKLQLWKYEHDIQFMDEADNEISRDYIEKHFDVLEPIIKYINNIQFTPEAYITEEQVNTLLLLESLKENPYIIEHIPNNFITKQVIKNILNYRFETEEMNNLYHIFSLLDKNKLLTSGYQFEIAMIYPKLISDIDASLITQDFAKNFLIKYPFLKNIPQELLTEKMCFDYLLKFSKDFEFIPDKFKTYNFCKKIIHKNTTIFHEIPDELKTEELCELALKNSPWNICFIPKHILKNSDFMDVIYKQAILDFRNENIIMPINIGINFSNYICHIPEKYITDDDYKLYIKIFKKIEDFFPKNKMSYYKKYLDDHIKTFSIINHHECKQNNLKNTINEKRYKKQIRKIKKLYILNKLQSFKI
jgi:hypothetical protein